MREISFYLGCGSLCGYALAALLFFDNRLPLSSLFFLKLAFWFALTYGVLGVLGGAFSTLVWRGLRAFGPTAARLHRVEDARGRAGVFVGTALFATLFFWHFDSFYRYSTFGFGLLVKRLLTESFAPVSASGITNLFHLVALVLVAVLVPLAVDRAQSAWGAARWRRGLQVAVVLVAMVPWGAEAYLVLADPGGPTLRARPGRKVLLIGVDALDWLYANEYMAAGEMPVLSRLAREGLFTPLQTFAPAYSPMVWTTIATGRSIAAHNIRHFTAYSFASTAAIQPLVEPSLLLGNPYVLRLLSQVGLLQSRSVTGNARHVPAFWNISTRAGLTTAVLGWWASSPAEEVKGVMVGDYATHTDLSTEALAPHVFPAQMAGQVAKDLAAGRNPPAEWVERLFALTQAEQAEFAKGGEPVVVREVKRSLGHDYGLFHLARRLVAVEQPEVLAVFFEGIDTIGHLALHFERSTDPTSLDSVEVRRYKGINRAYYQIVDEMIGELVEAVDEETYIMVLADHGFALHEAPNYFHHKTGPPGVLVLKGPAIEPVAIGEIEAHIFDIAPTLLYALGLPIGEDMDGRVLSEAFSEPFKERYAVEFIASYDGLRSGRHRGGSLEAASDGASRSAVQRLKALGYIE